MNSAGNPNPSLLPNRGDKQRPASFYTMWEKPAEGNPNEAGQARMQIRIHVQSDGAPAGPKRARSSLNALSDIPVSITSWNLAGTLRWLDRIRAAETAVVLVCQRIWTTVDTTHNGAIILMHDGGGDRSQTVAALPTIINTLKQRGFHFVTIQHMIENLPSGGTGPAHISPDQFSPEATVTRGLWVVPSSFMKQRRS